MLAATLAASLAVQEDPGRLALEAALRESAKARPVFVRVSRSRAADTGPLPEEAVFDLDYSGPGVFRVYQMGVFGDGQLFVSDGRRMLRDPLEGDTVYLSPAPKSFASVQGPGSVRSGMPLVFALLEGEAALGTLLAKDGKVESRPEGKAARFSFPLEGGGTAAVVVEAGRLLRTELAGANQGGFRNRAGTLLDEVVAWSRSRLPKSAYSATPPPGAQVVEERGPGTMRRSEGS